MMKWPLRSYASVLAGLIALPAVASAQIHGDCDQSGDVSLGEVMTCTGIFLTRFPLEQCVECDRNIDLVVSLGEVIGALNCYFDVNSPRCRQVETPPPPTPTPTDTPVPPTATNTPEPPTATATATETPVPPTDTPTPEPTATPTVAEADVLTFDVLLQPPGGSEGNCRGTCQGGPNAGAACGTDSNCRLCETGPKIGNACGNNAACGSCAGGPNAGLGCTVNANCPESTCTTGTCSAGTCGGSRACVGGPFDGRTCLNAQACTECRGNFNGACQGGANNGVACTGDFLCPGGFCRTVPSGSCATIQGSALKVIIAPNGVCAPRTVPDVPCASDLECPSGKTCQLPGFRIDIDRFSDEDGIRTVRVHGDSFALPPAPVPLGGFTACLSAAGDGLGFIDCTGGETGNDITIERDHNTTPGSPGNSGPAVSGFANDPNCDTPLTTPLGDPTYPCLEGSLTCDGGENAGLRCTTIDDCPGGTGCNPCSTQTPPVHPNVCNSPNRATVGGTFAAGDMIVIMPLAILQLQDDEFGPDGLPCTEDDEPASAPAAVPVTLSTGLSTVRVFDGNNNSTVRVAPEANCPFAPCVTRIQGAPVSCSDLDEIASLTGTTFGGGFPALDIAVIGDMATTFKFEVLSSELVE